MLRLWKRSQRYEDLSVSIEEHIEERTEELMEEGLPREEAEQAARREFGNVTQMTERSREAWQWRGVESLLADLKLAFAGCEGARICGDGAADAGDRDRRQHGGLQGDQ